MRRRIGPLQAEVTQGEGQKFTAPMLLVHGLWDSATVWRPFAGYLSHRGWSCFAVELGGGPGDARPLAFDRQVDGLRAAIDSLDSAPVVLAHDAGALVALHNVDTLRALVALAPLVPSPPAAAPAAVLCDAESLVARWLDRPVRAPRGRWRGSYPRKGAREPLALIRELAGDPRPLPAAPDDVPCLVLVGDRDAVTGEDDGRRLAAAVGAELEVVAGGHALPAESGWEERVARVHRWVIKKLGAPLLALYEEAVAERDG